MRGFPTLGDKAESGPEATIHYLRLASGEQPAQTFLDQLQMREEGRFRALLRRKADGQIGNNREQFALVEHGSGIYAFKTKAYRLLCFHDADHLILLVGGGQIDDKLPRSLVKKAKRLREEYRRGKIAVIDRRAAG